MSTETTPVVRSAYIGDILQFECVADCGAMAVWEHADEDIADQNAWCDEHLPDNAEQVAQEVEA